MIFFKPHQVRSIFLSCFLCGLFHSVSGQSTIQSEQKFYNTSIQNAISNINEEQKAIYTGPVYVQYFIKMGNDGHPFFPSLKPESITYSDIPYARVNFIYDIFKDEIAVLNPDSNWICLDKSKISKFSISGHHLRKIDTLSGIPSGFYEILHEGSNTLLLAKWSKLFKASVWVEKVTFFLITEKVYPLSNKKDLLQALRDKDNEIKNFIDDNKLNFKKEKRSDFKKVLEFYSSLSE
jgi:hypothetical protein